jgi:hypothetical protein
MIPQNSKLPVYSKKEFLYKLSLIPVQSLYSGIGELLFKKERTEFLHKF